VENKKKIKFIEKNSKKTSYKFFYIAQYKINLNIVFND